LAQKEKTSQVEEKKKEEEERLEVEEQKKQKAQYLDIEREELLGGKESKLFVSVDRKGSNERFLLAV
jgi:hypothetical protein